VVFVLSRMGVGRDRISVVPCGVDATRFTPGDALVPGRLVSVGRLVPRKGFQTTIEALASLPGTELLVAGGASSIDDDAHAASLRSFAGDMGVADRVRLLGAVSRVDMPALLRSAEAVVCTPWYEPFGIVPLEAMACGVPVVAAAVGGLTDTVVDGVTGRLVPPRDPSALATTLADLLATPANRGRLGRAGRQRACRRYSWDRVAAETVRVYERAGVRDTLAGLAEGVTR
jgi:glycosyltransferase involved in cell wall biosynthesis